MKKQWTIDDFEILATFFLLLIIGIFCCIAELLFHFDFADFFVLDIVSSLCIYSVFNITIIKNKKCLIPFKYLLKCPFEYATNNKKDCTIYWIRNSFFPNDVLYFCSYDEIFQQIEKIPKQILLKAIVDWKKNNNLIYSYYKKNKNCTIEFVSLDNSENQKWKKFASNDNKMIEEKNTDIINVNLNSIIVEVIDEIDQLLKSGFVFSTISIDRWQDFYRQEILAKLNSKYALDSTQEERIISILKKLKNSMYDKNKEKDELDKNSSITAMEEMLKLDGVDGLGIMNI